MKRYVLIGLAFLLMAPAAGCGSREKELLRQQLETKDAQLETVTANLAEALKQVEKMPKLEKSLKEKQEKSAKYKDETDKIKADIDGLTKEKNKALENAARVEKQIGEKDKAIGDLKREF